MGLVRLALGNVYAVVVLALIIMVLGAVAIVSLPVDILPAFKTPAVQVLTYYNGMPAESVEKTITNRIERWVNQAPGARLVESRSLPGVSVVKVFFRDDIDPNAALTVTNSLALGTLPTLPPNTLAPVVMPFDPTGTLPLGILTVSNPRLNEAAVKDVARIDVRNMLGKVKGSVAPVVVGGKDRNILVYLDPRRLEDHRLSPLDVVKALQEGNLMVTPGTAYFGDTQVLLDTNAMVRGVADLNRLPVKITGTDRVLLEDIGHAEDAYSIQTSRVRVNGRPQVFVPIYRQGGASSLDVAKDVRESIPEMQANLPEGTKLDFVMDQSTYVERAIKSLLEEGALGAVLVGLMILVFLGNLRMTFIAVMVLPLAIITSTVGLAATGHTINVMTLAGLFLAIGPLVDNAIVVLENTHRHLAMGKNPVRAAYDGAGELTLPVLLATCCTVIVLLPLAFSPGVAGFLFRPLTLAVGFAMLASFALAWTFVPAMCSILLKGHHPASGGREPPDSDEIRGLTPPARPGLFARLHARFDAGLGWVTRRYLRLLDVALRHRMPVLAAVSLLFVGSLLLFGKIGQEFFPQVDTGQFSITVRAPSDTRLDAAERYVAAVEEVITKHVPPGERQMVVSEIGLNPDWSAAYTPNAGQQDAVIRVQLNEKRRFTSQQYAAQLRKVLADDRRFAGKLEFAFDTGGMVSAALNFGTASPIDIAVEGGRPEQAMELAQEIRRRVRPIQGAADVRVVQRLDAPYLVLEVKREEAAAVGLSARDVILQVVAAMNSSTSINRNFWIDTKTGNQYFVAVQYPEDPDRTLEALQNVFAVTGGEKQSVKLSSLVNIKTASGAVGVSHASLRRVTNILVNTEGRDIGSLANEVHKVLRQLDAEGKVPKGMKVELRGEYARMTESFRSLGGGLLLAALLVYLLMVPLFRSFAVPLVIMFTVPLGLIGVLVTLFVTRTTLNIQSEMGVIFLVGIVVSNGVLLLDFAGKQRREGATVREAVRAAARTRFRPILMTFLATFLDLLPLAIGLGKGSEAITPLARAVVGGLLTSTALTLFVVPVLYTLMVRDRPVKPFDLDKALAEPEREHALDERERVE
jgi:multidrug efflux pump subunit AcrB